MLMQSLLGCVPRAGLYRGSLLSFLRLLHTDFHNDLTSLAFPPAVYKGSSLPHTWQYLLSLIACFLFFSFLFFVFFFEGGLFCFVFFWGKASVCRPGWSQTHFSPPPASASLVLDCPGRHHARLVILMTTITLKKINVALMCMHLMAKGVEHFFTYLLVILSSCQNCLLWLSLSCLRLPLLLHTTFHQWGSISPKPKQRGSHKALLPSRHWSLHPSKY